MASSSTTSKGTRQGVKKRPRCHNSCAFSQIDKVTLDEDNDLFYGLKVAGTSLGIVTEFLYKIYEEAGWAKMNHGGK